MSILAAVKCHDCHTNVKLRYIQVLAFQVERRQKVCNTRNLTKLTNDFISTPI